MSLANNVLVADSGGSKVLSNSNSSINNALSNVKINDNSNIAYFRKDILGSFANLPVSNTVNDSLASSLATYKASLLGNNSAVTAGETSSNVSPVSSDSFNSAVSNSDYSAILDRLEKIANSNTAKSIELANYQNEWQEQQNAKAMDFNSKEAAINRDWQEYMSNTAHQREVQDLIAAGLNPVLSATGGNGAAVTSGATASGYTSSGAKGDVDTSVSSALSSFLNSLLTSATAITTAGISSAATLGAAEKSKEAAQYSSTLGGITSLIGSVLHFLGLKKS